MKDQLELNPKYWNDQCLLNRLSSTCGDRKLNALGPYDLEDVKVFNCRLEVTRSCSYKRVRK